GDALSGPALEHRHGRFHMAVRRPIRIEGRRFVRDADVIDERRDDSIAPDLIDKATELRGIEHPMILVVARPCYHRRADPAKAPRGAWFLLDQHRSPPAGAPIAPSPP